jgi:hypothetical protein
VSSRRARPARGESAGPRSAPSTSSAVDETYKERNTVERAIGGRALVAAEHYTSIFEDGNISEPVRNGSAGPGEEGTVLTVDFELAGRRYIALNGGPSEGHVAGGTGGSAVAGQSDWGKVKHRSGS